MTLSWIGIYYYFFKHLNTHHTYFNDLYFCYQCKSWIHYFYIIEKIDHAISDDEFMWYIDQEQDHNKHLLIFCLFIFLVQVYY